MKNFASLCILAYKRPDQLITCLDSIHKTIDYPCEVIVNLDAEEHRETAGILSRYFVENKISKLILNNGKNRGVGRSFQNCLGVCEGDYIFKIDTDLIFKPKWVSSTIKILADESIGAVGLFDYNKWDSNDERFKPENNIIEKRKDYLIVKDFVSSIYAFREDDKYIFEGKDDGFHTQLQISYGKLALLDKVDNTAFGVGKSTYVSGTMDHPIKTLTFDEPLIFQK